MPEPIQKAEGSEARAMNSIEKSLFENEVIEALRQVFDPEIPINIYDLGLIYDIQIDDQKNTHILMTLTSPMCPVAGILPGEAEAAVRAVPGIGQVTVELTWDPPFTVERMSEEAKLMLGFM